MGHVQNSPQSSYLYDFKFMFEVQDEIHTHFSFNFSFQTNECTNLKENDHFSQMKAA